MTGQRPALGPAVSLPDCFLVLARKDEEATPSLRSLTKMKNVSFLKRLIFLLKPWVSSDLLAGAGEGASCWLCP